MILSNAEFQKKFNASIEDARDIIDSYNDFHIWRHQFLTEHLLNEKDTHKYIICNMHVGIDVRKYIIIYEYVTKELSRYEYRIGYMMQLYLIDISQ